MGGVFEEVYQEGYREGYKIGLELGCDQVIKALKKTMTDEQVATVLGLSLERVVSVSKS